MIFEECFKLLIPNEGGLSLDREDRGNWTSGAIGHGKLKGSKYGISAASYPDLDIANLTLDDARFIYRRDFWDELQLDAIPDQIDFDMFDMAINSGISRAIKLLQKTVGAEPDGVLGPKTLHKTNSYGPLLRQHLNAYRLLYYTSLSSSWETQGKGWTNRVANNMLKT